jgi:ubiquinone/menaquinone biosynthesis C-methylase UbiE
MKYGYDFQKYINVNRWSSYYHQIDEILSIQPNTVLEIGVGRGIVGNVLKHIFDIKYESLDIDENLKPDHVGDVLNLPLPDNSFDVVCAFQVLEHLPFQSLTIALREMLRTANKAMIISLPDAGSIFSFRFRVNKMTLKFLIPNFLSFPTKHKFDGEHYWEINKRGYSTRKIRTLIKDIASQQGFYLKKEFRNKDHPYHRFFTLVKQNH